MRIHDNRARAKNKKELKMGESRSGRVEKRDEKDGADILDLNSNKKNADPVETSLGGEPVGENPALNAEALEQIEILVAALGARLNKDQKKQQLINRLIIALFLILVVLIGFLREFMR